MGSLGPPSSSAVGPDGGSLVASGGHRNCRGTECSTKKCVGPHRELLRCLHQKKLHHLAYSELQRPSFFKVTSPTPRPDLRMRGKTTRPAKKAGWTTAEKKFPLNPVLSLIKPQAPLLLVPFRQFRPGFSLASILLLEPKNFDFSQGAGGVIESTPANP